MGKTYCIVATTDTEINAIEFLRHKAIIRGKSLAEVISEHAIEIYNRDRIKKTFTAVSEKELLRAARECGLTAAKSSLVQYRRKGVLSDESGPWFWQNDQNKVVYNLEKMVAFLKQRAEAPKSRIKSYGKQTGNSESIRKLSKSVKPSKSRSRQKEI